ncbi:hypothetical protein Tco_0656265 [Tanacetum coccineum]|uniref:Uncharacterized protein n=1 Tax=Tanacetum coccineum TaxID=301880 RepID=A0ABQ4X8B4_9ASTR
MIKPSQPIPRVNDKQPRVLKVHAKKLFGNENVWVQMHRGIAWDKTLGTPIEVEPLDETQLVDLGLNTCNHDNRLSSREVLSFDKTKPQPQPLTNCPPLDISLGDKRGLKPPIKPHSLDSFRMKEVDHLANHTPPSPHMASLHHKDTYCYYHPCIGDPKKHYGFKPRLLGHSGSLGVNFSKLEMIEDDLELESKEVYFLGRGFNSPVRPKEVEKAYRPTDTDTKSEPFEDPIEIEEPQSLPITSTPIPLPDYTPATPHTEEESKPIEAYWTRVVSLHSTTLPLESTSPLSPDHLLTQTSPTLAPPRAFYYRNTARMTIRTQPTLSPDISDRVTEVMTLSPSSFCKRYKSSYETLSSSSSPTLASQKRYQGTSKPIVDTKTEGDEPEAEGTESESEEPKDELAEGTVPSTYEVVQSSWSVPVQQIADETPTPRSPVYTTWEDLEDDTIYRDIKCDMPLVQSPVQTISLPVQIPSSPVWSLDPLSEAQVLPSLVATPVSVRPVDEGYLAELGAQLELHGSILHDHTQRLDALLPTLLRGMVGTLPSCLLDQEQLDMRFTHSVLGLGA